VVRADRHRDGRDAVGRRLGDLGREATVDQTARQVPQQVDDARPGELGDQLAVARPDAGERREANRGKSTSGRIGILGGG